MKTSKYLLISLFVLVGSVAFAQDDDKFPRIEEMHNRKWQFLVTQAQLTPDDIAKVQPIFMEYEKAVWSLHKQNHEFFRLGRKGVGNVNPNYAEMNDKYVDFELKQAQLFKNYHLQLRKLLDPETLFKYYKADREFKRKLLQDFQDRRPPERSRLR